MIFFMAFPVASENPAPFGARDRIAVEISLGELFDKITILEIKARRIPQPEKQANIRCELSQLHRAARHLPALSALPTLTQRLKMINESLWEVEDAIRVCERKKDFGRRFIELARRVYYYNDARAGLKRQINELFGSRLREEKSYVSYR